jgi:hypothetical protein
MSEEKVEVKAYDVKELLDSLKADGLELTEEALKTVAGKMFDWFERGAKASVNPYDDLALGLVNPAKKLVMEKLEKINPED